MDILFNSKTPDWSWLSNFSPHPVAYFPTAEHAYQACKSTDPKVWAEIAELSTPTAAKAAGYKLHIRSDWSDIKIPAMRKVLRYKFKDLTLEEMLRMTGTSQLIHYAPWGDMFWGVDKTHTGSNMQGQLLMELRDRLRRERAQGVHVVH